MDFEEYVQANYKRLEGQTRELVEDAFKAGQQSKQAEIDELQKMIGTALRHLEDHEGYDDLTHVIKILKGELK